jgi:hypothetical protein
MSEVRKVKADYRGAAHYLPAIRIPEGTYYIVPEGHNQNLVGDVREAERQRIRKAVEGLLNDSTLHPESRMEATLDEVLAIIEEAEDE